MFSSGSKHLAIKYIGGTFVAVSFVSCSVLFSFKCFNFNTSVCPII